jgi:hypothetical protein
MKTERRRKAEKKRHLVSVIIVCLGLLYCNYIGAFPEEIKPFVMPPEIARLKTASEVAPFLSNRAAIIRLGEIGGVESVNLLVKTFKEQSYVPSGTIDWLPNVRVEAIRALSKTKRPEAKEALYGILKEYMARGPQNEGPRRYDVEYGIVLGNTFTALSRWRDEEDVFETLKKIAFDKDGPASRARTTAYKNYLLAEMSRQRISTLREAVHFLIGKWTKGGNPGTDERVINDAISRIIEETNYDEELWVPKGVRYGKFSKNALPFLKEELRNIPLDKEGRYHALDVMIRYLEVECVRNE